MDREPRGIGALIILAPIACCGLLFLVSAGALGGLWAWLADGGAITIILAALLAGSVVFAWRRFARPRSD